MKLVCKDWIYCQTVKLIAAACILIPAETHARDSWIHFGALNWKVGLEYDSWREERDEFGNILNNQYKETFEIEQTGYVISPKLLDFSITLVPTFTQRRNQNATQDMQLDRTSFDYDVNLRALRGTKVPIELGVDASRGTGTFSSNLGRRTDFTREEWSLSMFLKTPAFPMSLSYRERILDESSRSGGASDVRSREESQQSILWQGRSSKLNMQVEKRWFDDWIDDRDYDLLRQTASHNLHWGKNSNLTTRQSYLKREGANPYTRHAVSENLRLQHLDNLYSTLSYNYSSITAADFTKSHIGNYFVTYQPTGKLRTALGVQGQKNDFGAGILYEYGGRANLTYQKDIFWKGKLNFNLEGSSLVTDFESNGSTFESLDISHTVPTTLLVLLNTRAIDTSSILVTDSTGSQVFLEGVDYITRTLSGDRVELRILLTGLIEAGDTIFVSYRAAAQPSARYNADSVQINLLLDFNWVRFFHSSGVKELTLQSGSFGEGQNDSIDQSTGVELKWLEEWFEASVKAETRLHESGDFSTTSDVFTESAEIDLSARAHLVLSAKQIYDVDDGRETNVNQWQLHLDWRPLRQLSVRPYVSGLYRQDIEERFVERLATGARLSWRIRKLELDLNVSYTEHETQDRGWTEQRVGLRIVRRSR